MRITLHKEFPNPPPSWLFTCFVPCLFLPRGPLYWSPLTQHTEMERDPAAVWSRRIPGFYHLFWIQVTSWDVSSTFPSELAFSHSYTAIHSNITWMPHISWRPYSKIREIEKWTKHVYGLQGTTQPPSPNPHSGLWTVNGCDVLKGTRRGVPFPGDLEACSELENH